MFYSQTCENIELVVFTLDGGLLDINRLRYNYYRSTCETYHLNSSRDEFSSMLGNMNTMYDKSPLNDYISSKEYNQKVEKDLFEYIKLKPSIKREGIDELIQYCRQKRMKIAVYTTHKTKRAIQYLQLTGLYNKIDFLIGGDSNLKPLPDGQLIEVICQQMKVDINHTLVVANFESMVEAANSIMANVVYLQDLVPATNKIIASVFKVTKNPLEIMNMFLFSKYDSIELFSPLLGMNANMDLDTLTDTRNKLLDKYQDDEQLIELVNKTYDHFNEILSKQFILEEMEKEHFSFDDTNEEIINEISFEDEDNKEIEELDQTKEYDESLIEDNISNNEQSSILHTTSVDPKRINELMDIINGTVEPEEEKEEVEEVDEEVESNKLVDFLINIVYQLLVSIIFVFIGLIINVLLNDGELSILGIENMLKMMITGYINIITIIFSFIFNTLNSFISVVPSYDVFVYNNSLLSSMAALSLFSIIFNFIVISLIAGIYRAIKNK